MKNQSTQNLIAKINNPESCYCIVGGIKSFPGMDALGLNPENDYDKKIAHAICMALFHGTPEFNESALDCSYYSGVLDAMFEFGVVKYDDVVRALWRIARN